MAQKDVVQKYGDLMHAINTVVFSIKLYSANQIVAVVLISLFEKVV